MTEIKTETVISRIQKAIVAAQDDYKMSAEDLLCNAPEYLLTVYIYQDIISLRSRKYLTLEEKPKTIYDLLEIKKRGKKPKELRYHGRCDLVLWYSSGDPRAVIEVKRNHGNYLADIKRLSTLLKADLGLEFSVFACCIQRKRNKRGDNYTRRSIESSIEVMRQKVQNEVGKEIAVEIANHSIKKLDLGLEWEESERIRLWRPICFVLRST